MSSSILVPQLHRPIISVLHSNIDFFVAKRTGKTTIARHYALFLQQLQIVPDESVFQETNGTKLIQGGVKGLQDLLEDVKKKGGGTIL